MPTPMPKTMTATPIRTTVPDASRQPVMTTKLRGQHQGPRWSGPYQLGFTRCSSRRDGGPLTVLVIVGGMIRRWA